MAIQTQRMTVEEFWQQYAGQPYELVRGRVVEVSPSGFSQSAIAARVVRLLDTFVSEHGLGIVTGADGDYYLSPEDLRAPDAAFVTAAKVATLTEPEKFAPFAPDLAVEVVSPGNTATEMRDKVRLYLDAGTQQVWLVYPESTEVDVYDADGTWKTFTRSDTLDGGTVLPGLNLAVGDLFPEQEDKQSDEGTAS